MMIIIPKIINNALRILWRKKYIRGYCYGGVTIKVFPIMQNNIFFKSYAPWWWFCVVTHHVTCNIQSYEGSTMGTSIWLLVAPLIQNLYALASGHLSKMPVRILDKFIEYLLLISCQKWSFVHLWNHEKRAVSISDSFSFLDKKRARKS